MKTHYPALRLFFFSLLVFIISISRTSAQTASALNFDGSNDYVYFGSSSSWWNLGNNFTLEMWIKPNSTSNQILLYAGYGCIVCPQWVLGIGPEVTCGYGGTSGRIVFTTILGARIESDASPTIGVWSHIAVTYDGDILKMYVNGILQTSTSSNHTRVRGSVGNPSYMAMGMDPGCGGRLPFNGSIDEFRVWSTVRTQGQVQSYMNCEIPTSTTNLVANFHFNEGIANGSNGAVSTLTDAAGVSSAGNLYNFNLSGTTSNWIGSGPFTNGLSTPTTPTVSINISGNSVNITDGDLIPSTADFTNFNGAGNRTFVIQNTVSGGTLNSGVYFTGPGASDFSVTTAPTPTIAGIGNTSYVVSYMTNGTKTATMNINNNSTSDPVYSIGITASSTGASCMSFDGINDGIDVAEIIPYDFTIEFWMRSTQAMAGSPSLWYNGPGLVDGEEGGIQDDFGVALTGGGGIAFGIGNPDISIYSTSPVNTGKWVHVAATRSSGTGQIQLYINGVLEATGSASGSGRSSSSISLGRTHTGTHYYLGDLDEVRLWARVRSQCEILQDMNREISLGTSLFANFHFNEGVAAGNNSTVTTLIDESGYYNHGQVEAGVNLTGTISNWVNPGAIVTDYAVASSSTAVISVQGNGNVIVANDFTPSTTDFTDFQTNSTRTFVISNTGTGLMNINAITFQGAAANEFSVTSLVSSTLGTSGTTSFVVAFTPTAGGTRAATLMIASTDCNTPGYDFLVQGVAPNASALNFDGVDDYVETNTNITELGQNDFTIEAWIKTSSNDMGIVSCENNNGIWEQGEKCFYIENTGELHFVGHSCNFINSTYTVNDGNWHHVAVVWHVTSGVNGIGKIYVDGIDRTVSSDYAANYNDLGTFKLGMPNFNESASYFNGNMDEVRIWNVARTACQIQSYMHCEITSTASGLVANYHFNEGAVNLNNSAVATLTDATASNISGSLTNFSLTGTTSNWVSPGGVTNGYTTVTLPSASIAVSANSNSITNNSSTTFTSNGTNFGTATSQTFVVTNSNTGTLTIGIPYLTGTNAGEFSITVLPGSTLAAAATTSFVVAFTPTAGGTRTASVSINNNDCNIPIFSYAIRAQAPTADALSFDGIDDVVSGPVLSTNTTSVSLQAKVYWYGTTSASQMLVYNGNSSTTGYGIYNASGSGALQILYGGVSFTPFNYTLTPNVWTSLTAVLRNGNVECYANGVLTSVTSVAPPNVPSGNFTIGNNNNGSFPETFNGRIDEVRFWNKALSQCEIQTYQNCEIPGAMTNLVGNYHFNEGSPNLSNLSVTTLTDASGNGNDLTLNNMALTGTVSNWVSPGAVTAGYTITAPPTASISLTGNGNPISNNSTATSTLNATDFGTATTQTFVIHNSISGTLNINNVSISGTNASEFSVTVLPASTLNASSSTSFVVAFTPTTSGVRVATINILNNDCNIPIFNFAIQGAAPLASALRFDGVDDYINLPSNNLPTGNSDFTTEFWVKINSSQAGHRWISSLGSASSGSLITIGYDGSNSNKIRIHHYGPDLVATTASITPNVWTHVAVNYRGNTYASDIFINGIYIETLSFGAPLSIPANPVWQIGVFSSTTSYCPSMDLDEFRMWSRALCAPEIQNNMHCELATTGNSLVANYHFNEGAAIIDNSAVTTLTDASGSVNTGTLQNFALTGTVSNWCSPGAVTSGSSCSIYLTPEINLMGNGISIMNGNTTPVFSNNTDFQAVCANTVTTRTFSIQSLGTGPLTVSSISMTGSGASSFSISALSPASPIAASGSATFSVTFTPATVGVINATLLITSNDCNEGLYLVGLTGTANALPTVTANASNPVICNTFSTSVNGSGANTYTWSGTIPATNGVPFTPSVTSTYSLAGTSTLTGCTSTNIAMQTITVNALPVLTVAATSSIICTGNSTTLNVSGANTYTWNPGALNGSSINVTPALTSTYSATGTNTLTGCTSTNLAAQVITVNAIPTVTASVATLSVCTGQSATLTASGANTYTWNPGSLTGATVYPVLNTNTSYTLSGQSLAGCTSTNLAVVSMTANPLPTVAINPLIVSICSGASASLSASGAANYTWNPGGLTGSTITPSPLSGTIYTVTGTSTAGCTSTNTATQNVTVNALPTVTAGASSSVICNTGTTSLIASGANTYTWNPGNLANGATVSPITTTNYTVIGTNTLTGCTSTNLAVQTISVNVSPTVAISVIQATVCAGKTPTLTASNANSYTWTPGNYTTASISPTLNANTVFTLSGSSLAGCMSVNTPTQLITVNPLPVVTASASSPSVCTGNTLTLYGGGASSYTWTGGVSNATAFTPTASGAYTVTGTDANNCQNTATIGITLNSRPTVSANITSTMVCAGTSITLGGSGASTYSWTSGVSDNQAFVPTSSQNYSLTGNSAAGCTSSNTAVVSVTVNALPAVTASISSAVICVGQTVSLTGGGASSYTWSGGETNNTAFSPSASAVYTVIGLDANSCQNSASVTLTVNSLPTLSITGASSLVCQAATTTLSASGAGSYTWSTSQTGASIVITPTANTHYSITGTDANGCSNTTAYTQSISLCLGTLTAIHSVTNVSCDGKLDGRIALTVSNSYSNSQLAYIWSPATVCPGQSCNTVEGLNGGLFSVMIKVTYTLNNILVKQDSLLVDSIVVLNENGPCQIKVYTGVTANGDGMNDTWQIDNITQFPKNKVTIFNRWGEEVFKTESYNNAERSWPLPGDVNKLTANTYFYLIDLGDGSKPIKGWVELMKN